MAFDLALRRQNNLNLTLVSGDAFVGRGTASLDQQAKTQLAAFAKRVNTLNATITNWYNQNKSNPAAGSFANRWIKWRDQAYGYIKAYKADLASRFLKETPPKEQQVLQFYRDWMLVSGTKPIPASQAAQARAAAARTPAAPSPTVKAPPPSSKKPIIRTTKAKKTPAAPSPSPFASTAPLPEPLAPEEPGKGRLFLIGGAVAAALGGGLLIAKSQKTGPRAARA